MSEKDKTAYSKLAENDKTRYERQVAEREKKGFFTLDDKSKSTDPENANPNLRKRNLFVQNLEVADVNRFFITDAGTFNAGQSTSEGQFDIYRLQSGDSSPFRDAIKAAIKKPGVTTDQILNRMLTLSCAGCHEHANTMLRQHVDHALERRRGLHGEDLPALLIEYARNCHGNLRLLGVGQTVPRRPKTHI